MGEVRVRVWGVRDVGQQDGKGLEVKQVELK